MLKKFIKRLLCKHEEKECITNFVGEWEKIYKCRSMWRCKKCGKIIYSDKYNFECEYTNYDKKR